MLTKDGFETLVKEVAPAAYRVAYGFTRNKEDALDLVQEATVLAYRGLSGFEQGSNFKAWFLRILTNRFLKTRAKKRLETVSIDDAGDVYLFRKTQESGLGNSEDAARLVLDGLDVEEVQRAMDALPQEFRTAAVLYFFNDFSYEQIAQVLEVPVGTVRSRLHRGRKILQKALWEVALERGIVREGDQHV